MTLKLEQFRLERRANGVVHLVFDMPGRSMNVFSNAAIHELGVFAQWLAVADDVRGVVIRSGKPTGFCAGADLGELGVAYDMIVAARPEDRFDIAFDHFFPLSHAIRRLERAGKPIAVAIAGIALGGGCELALGGHYRVLADDPKAALGLPESLVGLLPGGGGTQRLPRLVGPGAAFPILLEGARLAGQEALAAGIVDAVVPAEELVATAEAWLLSPDAHAMQPWDRTDHLPLPVIAVSEVVSRLRSNILRKTLGHYPAPLAILDCVEHGLPQRFDASIRTEMSIFAELIQRREARDMIQTLFLGKLDRDRATRAGDLTTEIQQAIDIARDLFSDAAEHSPLALAGFGGGEGTPPRQLPGIGYWLEGDDQEAALARTELERRLDLLAMKAPSLSPSEARIADFTLVSEGAFPAYLGGPFTQLARH